MDQPIPRPDRAPACVIGISAIDLKPTAAKVIAKCWAQMTEGTVLEGTQPIVIPGLQGFHYIESLATDGDKAQAARGRQDDAGVDPQPER